ncbi:MAG: hypothetical protein F4029_08035 [Gammaproteobacteria bacterium]|nr:hypothetical protein [Gammaproteobacteria bacterium]MXY55597.1 hypothetical protein [Gammaproteobacteria bacterium]MYF30979.1 hypothetical protein [Gammaproteobacteria bacterium]MYK46164.1 hypothetical protein [Gammaproteobacteria bacterium]
MCLVARHFEERGLPTLILGSALDILTAGKPPRAKFVNYPLGFESGRFRDGQNQFDVVAGALKGFDEMTSPGIEPLPFEWQRGWDMVRKREKGKLDHRSPRTTRPQYQTEEDRLMAERTIGDGIVPSG